MDSGNSGSLQSSSGDDQEYDSRPDLHHHQSNGPAFLNTLTNFSTLNPASSFLSPPPPPQPFFDPSSSSSTYNNNLQTFSQPHPHQLNLDLVGPGSLRSDKPTPPRSGFLNQTIKNPKKRTRASRRAPTTVLTTDTSNFRAMVQEFTGIPAPPFSASTYSRRFDLFGSTTSNVIKPPQIEPLYNSLRPKFQPLSLITPSSSVDPNNISDLGVLNNIHQNPVLPFLQPGFGFEELGMGSAGQDQLMRTFDMNFNNTSSSPPATASHRVVTGTCKLNYTANTTATTAGGSSSDFHHHHHHQHDKSLENVSSTRPEGTVDSWICPSD